MDEFTDGQDMTEDTEQIINDTEEFRIRNRII